MTPDSTPYFVDELEELRAENDRLRWWKDYAQRIDGPALGRLAAENDRLRAALEEVRSRLAYADGIEVEESLRTIDRVLGPGTTP